MAAAVVGLTGAGQARGALPGAPAGRSFERVSQQETKGITALQAALTSSELVSSDGDDVLFGGGASPTSADALGGNQDLYLAHRTSAGWVDSPFNPPPTSPYDYDAQLAGVTPDLSAAVFATSDAIAFGAAPDQHPTGQLTYRDSTGRFTSIVADGDLRGSGNFISRLAGISDDGQTVVYASSVSPAGLPSSHGLRQLYVWHPDRSVARVPDGVGEAADCGNSVAGVLVNGSIDIPGGATGVVGLHAVSSDGRTVFVASGHTVGTTDCAQSQIYVNRGGATTLISTPTEAGVPEPDPGSEAPASFVGASTDGSIAYFETTNQLTSNAPAGQSELYEWRAAHGTTPAEVLCASCDVAPNGVANPVTISSTGAYVYFNTAFDSNFASGFFVAHNGSARQIFNVPFAMIGAPSLDLDGDVAVVNAPNGELDRVAVSGASVQTACVSCDVSGVPQPADLNNFAGLATSPATGVQTFETVSPAGDRIVFESAQPLTADASPGSESVYLWTAGHGLTMIAPRAEYAEMTPNGSDIVFQSAATLTADTTQTGTETIYDARIGGGFPIAAVAPGCDPSGCRGVTPDAPGALSVTSGARTDGQPSAPIRLGSLRVPSRVALRRFVHGKPLAIRVSVSATTAVRAVLRTRGSGPPRILATAHAGARLGGRQITLALHLSRAARAAATRRHPVAVVLTVSVADGAARTVRFSLPGSSA